jgi:hypothetical protein
LNRERVSVAIVATHADLAPEVPVEEGELLSQELGAKFFSVSSKDLQQTRQPFEYLEVQLSQPNSKEEVAIATISETSSSRQIGPAWPLLVQLSNFFWNFVTWFSTRRRY